MNRPKPVMIANSSILICIPSTQYIDIPKVMMLEKKDVFIGKNVMIGAQVTVSPGTTIGENSVVGIRSTTRWKVYPADFVISGNPARVVMKIEDLLNGQD